MFREGLKPAMKAGRDGEWGFIQGKYTYWANGEGNLELTFTELFAVDGPYWFAFTTPWS
jgi:hypothetical protein